MNIRLNTTPVCLAKSQAVTVCQAKGSLISCRRGGTVDHAGRGPARHRVGARRELQARSQGPGDRMGAGRVVGRNARAASRARRDDPGLSVFRRFLSARSFQVPSLSS